MVKVGLVLEGGAMRGMFTAGVLDVFLDNNINIDGIIGVSAGALFGVNYFSRQRGRVIRYSKKYCNDLRYISIPSLILTGNIVNKNFAYYKVSLKLDPFDDETFIKSVKDFYATVTNISTGKAEYLKVKSCLNDMEILRASSAIPLYTRPVMINDEKYLDGAIADSIPVEKCLELGYDKIIVILTRPKDYVKDGLDEKTIKKVNKTFSDYPNFIEAMKNRYKKYNDTLKLINNLEKSGKIFVIRPSETIDLKVIERDKDKLQRVYDLGVKDANNIQEQLIKYLKK